MTLEEIAKQITFIRFGSYENGTCQIILEGISDVAETRKTLIQELRTLDVKSQNIYPIEREDSLTMDMGIECSPTQLRGVLAKLQEPFVAHLEEHGKEAACEIKL